MPASTQRLGFASASVTNRDVCGGADPLPGVELHQVSERGFDTDEVRIRLHGKMLVLEPLSHYWSWLESLVGPVDDDLVAATEELSPSQSRPDLDCFE